MNEIEALKNRLATLESRIKSIDSTLDFIGGWVKNYEWPVKYSFRAVQDLAKIMLDGQKTDKEFKPEDIIRTLVSISGEGRGKKEEEQKKEGQDANDE